MYDSFMPFGTVPIVFLLTFRPTQDRYSHQKADDAGDDRYVWNSFRVVHYVPVSQHKPAHQEDDKHDTNGLTPGRWVAIPPSGRESVDPLWEAAYDDVRGHDKCGENRDLDVVTKCHGLAAHNARARSGRAHQNSACSTASNALPRLQSTQRGSSPPVTVSSLRASRRLLQVLFKELRQFLEIEEAVFLFGESVAFVGEV